MRKHSLTLGLLAIAGTAIWSVASPATASAVGVGLVRQPAVHHIGLRPGPTTTTTTIKPPSVHKIDARPIR